MKPWMRILLHILLSLPIIIVAYVCRILLALASLFRRKSRDNLQV